MLFHMIILPIEVRNVCVCVGGGGGGAGWLTSQWARYPQIAYGI